MIRVHTSDGRSHDYPGDTYISEEGTWFKVWTLGATQERAAFRATLVQRWERIEEPGTPVPAMPPITVPLELENVDPA